MIDGLLRVWRVLLFLLVVIPTANASLNNFIITSTHPESGPTTGGTEIVLTGIGDIDGDELACVFAGKNSDNEIEVSWAQSNARWISPTKIMCKTPQWDAPSDNVTLSLELNGLQVAGAPLPFHYYESPIIESILPSSGAVFGGTKVSLRGVGFLPLAGMSCRFGSVDVPALRKSSNEITCTSPPSPVQSSQILSLTLNGVDFSISPVLYRYTEVPSILSIFPTRGSVLGGTNLTIFGRGFEGTSSSGKCVFRFLGNHTVHASEATFISSQQLTCKTLPVETPTRVYVHASINGVDATSDAADFEYIEEAMITSMMPSDGPVVGGTWVRLIGSGMVNGNSLRCRFGDAAPVPGRWISSTEIQCIAPPRKFNDVVNVSLSLNGLDYQTSIMEFSYYYPPEILSIRPTFGVSVGGTRVAIQGTGFLPIQDTFCRFGVIYMAASFVTEDEVSCISPPGIAGSSRKLSLSMNGVDFPSGSIEFKYISPIDVTSVHPKWVDEAGGTQLRVSGSEFHDTNDLACIFQNSQIESIRVQATFNSFTKLHCTAPPMTAPMTLTLRVTANGLDMSEKGAQFEYIRANIFAISPRQGTLTGGTQVKLTGSGFQFDDSICCRFGSTIVPATWISWTMVRCYSPPSSAGSVDLAYSNDGINFVNSTTMYSFILPTSVHYIEPTSGSKRGGIEVRIYGNGFSNEIGWKCVFNKASVSKVLFLSPSEITCMSPPSLTGSAHLTLIDPDGSFIDTGFMFHYYEDLVIESYFPQSSPIVGGTSIKLGLRGLMAALSYSCIFGGDVEIAAVMINSSFIECKSPQWDQPELSTISVEAINSSQFNSGSGNEAFLFYQQPNITRVSPSSVYHGFQADIIVYGGTFLNLPNFICRIGGHEVQARWISDSEILCRYPKFGGEYPYEPYLSSLRVCIASNGVDFHNSSMSTLNVHPDLTVTSISPSHGSMSALTRVAVSGTGFAEPFNYRCLFGTTFVNAQFQSPNKITCDSAPPSLPRRVSFWLCVDSGDCVGGEDIVFDFLDPLKVIDVSPLEGTTTGGTRINIVTNHPIGIDSHCVFGTQRAALESTDFNAGICTSPALVGNVSSVEFSLSTNGQEFSHEHFHFIYHPANKIKGFSEPHRAVIISRIAPVLGLPGTNVSVVGRGFDRIRVGFCTFGIRHVPITFVSNVSIICTAPWHHRIESVPFNVISELVDVQSPRGNITFAYIEHPVIISVAPSVIEKTEKPVDIVLEGHDFGLLSGDNIQCRIGSLVVQARLDDSLSAICKHYFPLVGIFSVELLSEQFGVLSSSLSKIRVIEIPKLHHLEPPIVVIKNATTEQIVMVKGENFFEHNLSCFIGDIQSHATVISPSEVLCRFYLSRRSNQQRYEVRISNGGEFDRSRFLLLDVILPPSINSISPSVGVPGRKLTISGNSFHQDMQCNFGAEVAATFFINSTALQCYAPLVPYEVSIPVSLVLFRTPVSVGTDVFFSNVNLSVISIRPAFGHVTGGTRVTFSMMESATEIVSHCIFGSLIVPVIGDRSELVCVSPPASHRGPVLVGVSINGEDFSTSHREFEYTLPAEFSGMQPNSGPESGGTAVTVAGANFVNSNRLACYFGNIEVPGRWISNERLICVSPAMQPGNYKVRVTLNGADIQYTDQKFDVYPKIIALIASPSFGSAAGGTPVHVYGTNYRLDEAMQCRFGIESVNATYFGPNMVVCHSPKWGDAEAVELAIVSVTNDAAVVHSGFKFYHPFQLLSIHPSCGLVRGGTEIIVRGKYFSQSLGPVNCLFGAIAANAVVETESVIRCITPSATTVGNVEFALSYGSDRFGLQHQHFEYEEGVILNSVSPRTVLGSAGKLITVFGSNFKNSQEMGCMIAENWIPMDAIFVSESEVLCRVPQKLKPGSYGLRVSNNGQDYSETTLQFNVIDPILIESLSPMHGPPSTQQIASLHGNQFHDLENLACLIDEEFIMPSHFISKKVIQCPLPLNVGDRVTVSISLLHDGVAISTGPPLLFTFIDLSVLSIRPAFGHVTGGTRVTFSMMESATVIVSHCIFGSLIVPVIGDRSELVCVSPPASHHGPVLVGVSVNGEDFSTSHREFEYTLPAEFSGMQPNSGPESGGTAVTVAGANFVNSNRLACYFGNIEVPGRWISNERLICVSPAMQPGNYKVRVTLNGFDTLRTPWQFTSQNEIDILYARPSSGSVNGGTEISIIGKSFVFTDYLACRFGNLGVSRATFISSTELLCVSPAVSIAQHIDVGIQISLNGVDFSAAVALFRLTPESFLREISPNKGTIDGGTQVTVRGVNFSVLHSANAAMCIFGNESVSALLVSTEEMTCVSPPHMKADEVEFAISLNGVEVVRYQHFRFQYLSNIQDITIAPSGGPFIGGTLVTVTGTDFARSRPIKCRFGSAYSDGILFISDQIIQCWSPPHPPGTVSFSITTEENEFLFDDVVFEYYKAPTILFASPTSGSKYGGTVVRIYGGDFRSNVHYYCKFGDIPVSGVYIATDAIQCVSPGSNNEETVHLDVAEKWSNITASTLKFSYAPMPLIMSISPRYVFADGDDIISMLGHNLNISHEVWCRFTLQSNSGESQYTKTLQGRSISNDRVDCKVPPYPLASTEMEAFVEISTNGQEYGLSRLSFNYAQKPKILGINPPLGSINGGTVVTVTGTDFIRESKLWCAFGYTESRAVWNSHDEIICISPSVQHLANDTLSLHFDGNPRLSESSYFYAYHQVLTVEGSHPTRGFVSGGTVVKIRGKGFIDVPSLSCYFGNIIAAAKFLSVNSIECLSPIVNQGQEVELAVSLNGIDISALPATSDRKFTYDDEVDLFHTIPSVVPVRSDPTSYVTVVGSSFINSTSTLCQFSRKYSTAAEFVSASELKCRLPKEIEEMKTDVRVSFNGVDFCRKTTSVSFVRPPLISNVVPERIPERQEVEILVRGQNFINSSLQCRFGRFGHLWSPAQWIDNATLKCVTPPLNASYDSVEYVGVSINGGHDREREIFPLQVTPRMQFLFMHPSLGYTDGGTEVVITFGNAIYVSNLVCQFEGEAIRGVPLTANSVVCKTPAYRPGESTLKLMSGKIALASEPFEYILPPIVTSLRPSSGAPEGGATVRISGTGFLGVTYCRFRFDDDIKIVRASVESDHTLSCDSPASDSESVAAVELSHNGQDFIMTGHFFKYRPPPCLHAITPSFGSDLGGTRVYASGENFVDEPAMCRFGSSLVDAIYISPMLLQCIAPAIEIGFVQMSILLSGVNVATNEMLVFESIKLPQIHSIAPRVGPVRGGTKILLETTALHNDKKLTCHFGDQNVPSSFQSANSALCIAPGTDAIGDVRVSISVGEERLFVDSLHTVIYTYVSEPKVTFISPNFGWTTGGEEVSLSVEYFGPFNSFDVFCSFGGENRFAQAVQVRLDLLVCRSPPYNAVIMKRHVPISLKISDGLNELILKSPPFTYHEPSLVTNVEPPFGSIHGGSVVHVDGFNFPRMPGLQCLFGEDIAADAEFIDDRKVICILPEWRGGARKLNVHLGARDGQKISHASNAMFEYLDHPSIESIHPRFGSIDGGTRVTLLGNALSWPHAPKYLSCRFGNSTVVAVETSKHDIVCTSPPGTGSGPVSIYANHGQLWLASSDESYVYTPPIELVSLSPNSGPTTGGTIVAISTRGLHLVPNELLTCHFGNVVVPAVLSEEKFSLECTSPPVEGNPSTAAVLVNLGINGSRDIDSVGCIFTYYRPPSINIVSPTFGFIDGGEDVKIQGEGFRKSEGLGCKFGGDKSPKVMWVSNTVLICTTPLLARTNMINAGVQVQITNNGMDYTDWNGAPIYVVTYRPDASTVEPSSVNWNESTNITIKGKNLVHTSACWFGIFNRPYQSLNVTNNSLTCEAPSAATLPISLLPSLSQRTIPIFLQLENGIIATGLGFKYVFPSKEYTVSMNQPSVTSIFPSYGSSQGGDRVRVHGDGFLNTADLACRFGEIFVEPTHFVSASEIHCISPSHVPGNVVFDVVNSRVEQTSDDQVGGFTFTFLLDISITTIVPSFGSINGGTEVNLFGSFPSLPINASKFSIVCKFGVNGLVSGELVSQNEIRCLSSPATTPGNVEVSVSLDSGRNFAKSTTWFAYVFESRIQSLQPNYGYPMGGTSVELVGTNFWNTTGLKCLFGESIVDATFQTSQRVSCISPPQNKTMDSKVAVKLVSEGRIGSSWTYFEYVDPPQISSIYPLFGQSGEGDGIVTITGSGFLPVMHLLCVFGKVHVRGSVVNDTTLMCKIPRHPNGIVDFQIIDQHASNDNPLSAADKSSFFQFNPKTSIYRVSPTLDAAYSGSLLLVRGANFDGSLTIGCRFGRLMVTSSIVSDSILLCPNLVDTWVQEEVGFFTGTQEFHSEYIVGESHNSPNAPNGTIMDKNFTLCEPGTFKPQSGPGRCLSCPIGFICPSFGLSTPLVCPAGSICDRLALVFPSSKCISGHYCNEGTKTQYPMSFYSTDAWNLDKESGVLTAVPTNDLWDYDPRKYPATGTRKIFHPPIGNVTAEQPIPCPVGYFCWEGVSSAEYREGDYSTPQPCSDGFFCSKGSTKPVGTGACPTGYYCPTQVLAVPCEPGHFCPGTGNVYPLPCFPGSYSSASGQSSCTLCEIGFQCPGFNRTVAEPCQAGWVCDEAGLSIPSKRCPSGFICEEGTTTDDPSFGIGTVPKPCPAGSFCLLGVAHNSTSSWLPSFEMGMFAPQPCLEGYFCPPNSSTPLGGGRCSPGSYCPESSPFPIKTPPGTFSGDGGGAIFGSLCLPGKFSPRSGQITCSPCPAGNACLGYGTYVPRICGPGTYRSKADSIQSVKCKSCPERTYSFDTGLTDISQCLPCAEGRVCGPEGMIQLKQSDSCSEGNVCGYNTARSTQFLSKCPSGSYCGNETTTASQYSKDCPSGHFCKRGTSSKLKTKDKCTNGYYCLAGTPETDPLLSRCPRQTSSLFGATNMWSCTPKLVAICDKMSSSETNPYDQLSYHPLTRSIAGQEESSEKLVVAKILPFDIATSDVMVWMNDTVEVFRTCPSYGILPDKSSAESRNRDMAVTIIGRNFVNSTTLTCRYKICLGSRWVSERGVAMTAPGLCHDHESSLSEPMTKSGVYISKTRVSCPLHLFDPVDDFLPVEMPVSPSSLTDLCLRDEKGQTFLSQRCSEDDLVSDNCLLEANIPLYGLRKRLYSLVLPCSDDEISNGHCTHVPTASSKLNPCLTQRMMVDISNMGGKFSGEGIKIPYTSLDMTHNNSDSSFQVLPTYAIYEFVPEDSLRIFEYESSVIDKKRLKSSLEADRNLCDRSSLHEEGQRLGEYGWFESSYMSRFHLSFDWRHLPDHLVYNLHFRLAIYVFPSRCVDSKCSGPQRNQIEVVHVPCLQPIDLPARFNQIAFKKHQVVNLTLMSLEDSRFRVEVQVVDGLAIPLANLFKSTMSIKMEQPRRAYTVRSKRRLSPLLSFDEKTVEMSYIFGILYDEGHSQRVSLPKNLPPRWDMFERGRVLIGVNSTDDYAAAAIKDWDIYTSKRSYFWDNPHHSATAAKRQSDLFFETFHGVSQDGPLGSYKYQHSALILPYLPYFSKCNEFDSHIPLWALLESSTQCRLPVVSDDFPSDWWRRKMPPLLHEDDVQSIGPMDYAKFYPVADWCERELHCTFDEDLANPDVTPRWFEADTGTALFSIIRDPIDYFQYTGRDSTVVSSNDGGGQRFVDSTNMLQMFIPAKVDRSSSLYIEGGCAAGACFPRKVTLDMSYYQVNSQSKRLVEVKVIYDEFDKDPSNDRYDLQIKFYALTYEELVVKFAFSRGLFILLFTQIGVGTVGAAVIYWGIVRLTTNLERPPRLRVLSFFRLSFSPAVWGFVLGLVPIIIVTGLVYYLMKGYIVFTPVADSEGRHWLFPSTTRLHYRDISTEPEHLQSTRQGRTGLAFITIGLTSLYWTSKMFVPFISSSGNEDNSNRDIVTWNRGNLFFSSVVTSLFLIIIVEWSFSASFGTYIWEAQIFLGILGIFVGFLVNKQLGDSLFGIPVMTAVGLVQIIVTMSANDFIDFLLSHIVGFGFLIIGRMYRGPMIEWTRGMFITLFRLSKLLLSRILGGSQDVSPVKYSDISPKGNNKTVEPLLESYASFSSDTLNLLYTPYIMLVLMAFRDEAEITRLYGIKEDDMEYYVIFALAIIPFQIVADIFFHNALELLHGWKIHEYLEYCNVRFLKREMWWKSFEKNTFDECIDDSLRRIDQMCFSSQYYMLNTVHLNGMLYFIIGIEMITRAEYTVFGDPIVVPLAASIILFSVAVKILLTSIARRFGLWKIKHEQNGWHSNILDMESHPKIEWTEPVQVDSQNEIVEQYMTSERFRYKFLSYNRSWILSQLPELITPRVRESQKPYMINQLAQILSELNEDCSSDSDSDNVPEFDDPIMTETTSTLARTWLEQAVRQLSINKLVQPFIMQAKGEECQICLTRSHLQVETLRSIAEIDKQFRQENQTQEIDHVLFKRFWKRHQQYRTICRTCVQKRLSATDGDEQLFVRQDPNSKLTSKTTTQSTESIMMSWFVAARQRLENNGNDRNHMKMSTRGPSLPPRVAGELIGTLTIRFLACSTTDTHATIQFWGESSSSSVFPLNDESNIVGSHAIEYPLVGSICAMKSYLTDASPLQVTFWRQNKGYRHPQWFGSTCIRDLCINNESHLDSTGAKTLLQNLKMVRPSFDMNNHTSHVIGEAIFEVVFQLYAHLDGAAPIASSLTQTHDSPHISLRHIHPENPPMRAISCKSDKKCVRIFKDDSVSEQRDFEHASSTAEKQSLLEELLKLCNDDMTIPTVESALHTTCFDLYDDWISRIVATTDSPSAKEFPCLFSRGINPSKFLRKVSLLKLDIIDMTLMVKVANNVKCKVLYLQYNSHLSSELTTDVDVVEIRLRKQPRERSKPGHTERKSMAMKMKAVGMNSDVLLHRIGYAKQIEVTFSHDDSVRRWLGDTLDFSLFCQASSDRNHPRLPRVATLAGKTKNTSSFQRDTDKVLLAKASVGLCDVIQSETLSVSWNLDLVAVKNDILEVSDADAVIGSLSVKLSLCPTKRIECSIASSATTEMQDLHIADRNEQISMKLPHNSSTPHPMSILLSHFAGVKVDDCVTKSSLAVDSARDNESTGFENAGCLNHTNTSRNQNTLQRPMAIAPDWLWIRVEKRSSLLLDDIKEIEGCLKLPLCMSCSSQIIQQDKVLPFSSDSYSVQDMERKGCILRFHDNNAGPINSVCLWKYPLETNTTPVGDKEVILYLLHCRNTADSALGTSDPYLVGLAKIPIRAKSVDASQILCDWLPELVARGPFDMLDPITNTVIGKFEVTIACGTQRQIDDFTKTYQSILVLQRWWIRSRTVNKRHCEEKPSNSQLASEINPEIREGEVSPDCSQEFDTIHAAFIKQHDRSRTEELTSPDSLFEEWSQQPITASKSECNRRGNIGFSIGEVHQDEGSIYSLRSNKIDAFQPQRADLNCLFIKESDMSHSSGSGETKSLNERTSRECDEIDELHMTLCKSTENEGRHYHMSCLKPMRLEDSFSRGQENGLRPSIGIDPPEEKKQFCKRKVETDAKRVSEAFEKTGSNLQNQFSEKPNVLRLTCPAMLNPLQDAPHNEKDCFVQYSGELAGLSQSESSTSCSRIHKEEDEDESESFRSLTSVLGTLEGINSILACGAFLEGRCCATDDTAKCTSVVAQHDAPDAKMPDSDIRLRKIERPDPGRHLEPPEENNVSQCRGRNHIEHPKNDDVVETIQTCERGSSPMSALTSNLVNASTSPSNITDTDETIVNGTEGKKPLRLNEERQSNNAECHYSIDNSDDDVREKGNDRESDERPKHENQLHAEISTGHIGQIPPHIRSSERFLSTYGANKVDAPIQNSSWQSLKHSRLDDDVSPHYFRGEKCRGSLSPLINYMDLPKRYCYFPRDKRKIRSSNDKVGANGKLLADKIMGALPVDTERLERIFQS